MNKFRKKILTLSVVGMCISGLLPQAGAVFADDGIEVESDGGENSELVQGGDLIASGEGLIEDQNTNVQSRNGISASGKKKKSSRKMIVGFAETGLIRTITYDEDRKPSIESLKKQFPDTVKVYFAGEKKAKPLEVSWECVGEDYSASKDSVFLFRPTFDSDKYVVRGMSEKTDAPYLEVKQNPSVAVEMIESAPPTVNEKKVFDFCIKELKMNKAAACGVLANMYCESGFRTNALGDGHTSVGLCQWHNGRWTNLKSYTEDWQKIEGQLDFMKYELEHGYKSNLDYLRNVTDDAQGAYDAAAYWCLHYEMPDHAGTRSVTRGYLAKNIYWPRYEEDGQTDEEGCNDSFAGEYIFAGEGSLNIRADHSEDSEVIGSVPAGAKVEVTKANGEWAHILYEGTTGLCSMEYLTAVEGPEEETETETETGDV